ncbi:MAG: glycine cleavage system aminomethyltransferase GcvT [Sutterellaceae bacterium]|nr:glycine cleavage system aminomethyltransferase GcvT [Burkholderiaceae bacterium]MDW8430310.1 glycine cleavage system aminomethyltransferase GcvT [Sutterellaceae bacterium]
MNLKRTPLYEIHLAAGARMVEFGGWEMPLHYGSQINEHHAVRRDAGMFDVSHMCAVDIEGFGAQDLLRTLLANDVARLTDGRALYSVMLNEAGGCLDDLIVYRLAADRYRLVVNAATADKDLAWIEQVRASRGFEAAIAPRRDLAMLAVQGPNGRTKFWQARPQVQEATAELKPFSAAQVEGLFVARTGYTGEDGFEILLPAAQAPGLWRDLVGAGVAPCGLGARDTLRLEAGMNLYGQDMDESVTPLEANLAWTVDLKTPRDFIGREALERQRAIGVARQLVGLKLLAPGVLRAHQRVATAHGEGEITSGSFSPSLACAIALARLPAAVAAGEQVTVDLRGRAAPALVVRPPFVRHGKALV